MMQSSSQSADLLYVRCHSTLHRSKSFPHPVMTSITTYLKSHSLLATLVGIRALDLELLRDHLGKLGRYLDHLATTLGTLRLHLETVLALHVPGDTLEYGWKEEAMAANAFENVPERVQTEVDAARVGAGRAGQAVVVARVQLWIVVVFWVRVNMFFF